MDSREKAQKIIKILNDNEYEAYIVGGYVRDYILKTKSNDIDITTSATPKEIQKIFEKTYPTGIKYGTISVMMDNELFEVTTFRNDVLYKDNRHPVITFSKSLEEDLKRRDFTINGMAMDCDGEIIDLFGGKNDLEKQIIRTIGNPKNRFTEDALRMLRAVYFASKLGFTIEDKTYEAIKENASLIQNVSIERIYQELKKIIQSEHQIQGFQILVDTNLSAYLPGLEKGLRFLMSQDKSVSIDEFFTLCFKLNEYVDEGWKFSTEVLRKYSAASDLACACENGLYTPLIMYSYTLPICLLANRVNFILGVNIDLSNELKKMNDNLPIHKTCDLVFKGQDIMMLTKRHAASWLGDLVDEIKYLVINGQMKNDYEEIKTYIIKRLKEEGCYDEK